MYRPRECWYHLSDPDRAPATPPCAYKQRCSFNLTERLECPFWQSGTFDSVETEVNRATDFRLITLHCNSLEATALLCKRPTMVP